MRPVCLRLKGFTSFKDETVLPFDRLDRFAICGATGAGKSSLLDAMTFALFADAPRVGTATRSSLIALGSRSFSIVLDFRVAEQLYRATRVRRHKGAGNDQLEKVSADDSTELIVSGADAVTHEIERLLGLKYDHFTQSVFLPQGKFAEFLHAKSGDRRELLNELLRLLVYERMQKRAGQEKDLHGARREKTERRLAEDFAGVSAEARAELEIQQAAQQEICAEAERRLPELRERWESARRDYQWTTELESKQSERTELEASQPQIDAARREAAAAERAAPVVPLLDEAGQARGEDERRHTEMARAAEACAQAEAAQAAAKAKCDRADSGAAVLPELRERLKRLAEARGKLALRDQFATQIETQERRRQALTSERAEAAPALAALVGEVDVLDSSLREAEAERDAIGFDPDRHAELEAEREAAVRLQGERHQLAETNKILADDAARAETAKSAFAKAQAEKCAAEDALARTRASRDQAEESLRSAEVANAAAHLREGVHAGEPCPVCLQTVARPPADKPAPILEELRRPRRAAQRHVERAEKLAAQRSEAAAAAAAIADSAADAAAASRAQANLRQRVVDIEQQRLEWQVGRFVGGPVGEPIEERVVRAVHESAGQQSQHRQAVERVQTLQNTLAGKRKDQQTAEAEIARLDQELHTVAEAIASDQAALARVQQEICAFAGTDDPAAESEPVEREIDRLERQLSDARAAEAETRQQLMLASTRVDAATQEAQIAAARAALARAHADAALQQAGFAGPEGVAAAARTPHQRDALRQRIAEHEGKQHVVLARIAEVEADLQGRRVSAAQCAEAEDACNQGMGQRQLAGEQVALLGQQLQDMENRLERARQLRAELAEEERHQHLYDQLARALRSDRFFAFLLEETLTGLVHTASGQLAGLTGDRYGLAFDQDKIFVVDHDNAGERRAVDTLSGGETFLASLALALALSEQVQRIAGAVHLDCLFID
jgi:DNA repair protein SbcC/Rad50